MIAQLSSDKMPGPKRNVRVPSPPVDANTMPSKSLLVSCVLIFSILLGLGDASAAEKPNFIVVFIDDMGYADIGPFGATKQRTPNLDRMAKEGLKLTDFYSSCSVCTPSRASLMTGCYPRRVNMHVDERNLCVLFPAARKGLHPDEDTIADVLKREGYATACIGKWHLGDHPNFLPTSQGFDEYFGIPYSNDMNRKQVPLPLVRDETVLEAPVDQTPLTERYTDEALGFIERNKDKPFFLYIPHTAIHVPLFPGKEFIGKSQNGKYGDWIEELDFSMGRVFKALQKHGLDKNTLVLFTSDNGSSRVKQGSNLPLRGRKGRTDEGGMRVPCVVRWPAKIPAGSSSGEITTTMDLLPTFANLAGAKLRDDRPIDGKDITPILLGAKDAKSPHEAFFYYQMDQLQAVRSDKWKLFVEMESKKRNWGKPEGESPLKLFDLSTDIHEDHNVAAENPKVVERLLGLVAKARTDLGDGKAAGKGQREAGWVDTPAPRLSANGSLVHAKPESVGMSSEGLGKIAPAMEKLLEKNVAAGIITMVARRGRIVHFETFGHADVGRGKEMKPDTIFRIYSMTKPIVSVALMDFWEEGKFQLDDPISKYAPEYKDLKVLRGGELIEAKREMTFRDILRHTSGLTYGFFSNTPVDQKYNAANLLDRGGTLEEMAKKLGDLPLLWHPGERWHYSVSSDVVGHLVEVLAKKPLDKVLAERVFEPLGMVDTGFHVPPDKVERFAANYGPDGENGLRVIDDPTKSRYLKHPSFLSGGGGLVSTANDYIRFCQMILDGGSLDGRRVLERKTVAEMTKNQLAKELIPIRLGNPRPGTGFGLGFSVKVELLPGEALGKLGEFGWGGAASTNFWIWPKENLIGLTLTQYMPYSSRVPMQLKPLVHRAIKKSDAR